MIRLRFNTGLYHLQTKENQKVKSHIEIVLIGFKYVLLQKVFLNALNGNCLGQ